MCEMVIVVIPSVCHALILEITDNLTVAVSMHLLRMTI